MNSEQKKQLKKMIKQNDVKDNTRLLRTNKKSSKIRKEVDLIQELKIQHNLDELTQVESKYDLQNKCQTLHKEYSNIYSKLIKNQIDVNVLHAFLDELEKIEKGQLNQHEASYNIGVLLKSLYVDKELDIIKEDTVFEEKTKETAPKIPKKISYVEYINMKKQEQ